MPDDELPDYRRYQYRHSETPPGGDPPRAGGSSDDGPEPQTFVCESCHYVGPRSDAGHCTRAYNQAAGFFPCGCILIALVAFLIGALVAWIGGLIHETVGDVLRWVTFLLVIGFVLIVGTGRQCPDCHNTLEPTDSEKGRELLLKIYDAE